MVTVGRQGPQGTEYWETTQEADALCIPSLSPVTSWLFLMIFFPLGKRLGRRWYNGDQVASYRQVLGYHLKEG